VPGWQARSLDTENACRGESAGGIRKKPVKLSSQAGRPQEAGTKHALAPSRGYNGKVWRTVYALGVAEPLYKAHGLTGATSGKARRTRADAVVGSAVGVASLLSWLLGEALVVGADFAVAAGPVVRVTSGAGLAEGIVCGASTVNLSC
jgi:hypothetical protein